MTAAPLPAGALGAALARFPLTPPVPARTAPPLEQRVDDLAALARRAAESGDTALAAEVHRRTALLHFDLGHPGTAYALCNLPTALYVAHRPLSLELACHSVELHLTCAELLVQEGWPGTAIALVQEILRAIGADQDAETAAVGILPLAGLTATEQDRSILYDWWDNTSLQLLATALVRAGEWSKARLLLKADPVPPPGPGTARQVETIALALGGQHRIAATLLAKTPLDPHTPWEHVVAAALTVACALLGGQTGGELTALFDALGDAHDTYDPTGNPLFDVQLTLACADLCTAADRPAGAHRLYEIATDWALQAPDGHSARALLEHDLAARLPEEHRRELTATTVRAGFRAAALPPDLDDRVTAALALAAEAVTSATSVAARLLGMDAEHSGRTPVTADRIAVFVRPDGALATPYNHRNPYLRDPGVPPASVSFALRDAEGARLPGLFNILGVHLGRSPSERLLAVEGFFARRPAPSRIIVGDFGEAAADEKDAAGTPVERLLAEQGMLDVARSLGTPAAMRDTAGELLGLGARYPAGRRCRLYADTHLAPAAVHLEVLPGYDDVSSRRPLLTVLDLEALRESVTAAHEHQAARKIQRFQAGTALRTERIAREQAAGLR
nr:hypothetical protein RKE32_25315 [Streptomyces sp. Li-HN-5-13]